jgi:electron transfer flavoprotein alpha subunit
VATVVMPPEDAQRLAQEAMSAEAPEAAPELAQTPSPEAPTAVLPPEEAQRLAQEAMGSSAPTLIPAPADSDAQQQPAVAVQLPAGGNAVLVLLDVSGDALGSPAGAALQAAQEIASARGAALHICCLGADTSVAQGAGLAGASVHTITDPSLGDGVSESYTAAALTALAALPADVIVGPATTMAKGFLPRLAEALDCGMISEILSVESADTFTRALWAGSVIGTVKGSGRLVISVRATGFDPATTEAASPTEIPFSAPPTKVRFVGREVTVSARPDLAEASVVVSGGRGTKGDFAPIEALADALGAAVGASRAACDAGWVPNDLQVGQTGKMVAPSLYIAVGISGAIQHIAGMKGSKVIVAINKDEDAPIFSVADYGLVADLFDVCPELADKVQSGGLKPIA